jgi:hypothetical protein
MRLMDQVFDYKNKKRAQGALRAHISDILPVA